MELIKTQEDLELFLKTKGYTKAILDIAIEGLIFNANEELILVLRSGTAQDERYKLEGIGGRLRPEDKDDLQRGLQKKIKEEIGQVPYGMTPLKVEIDCLLEVRVVEFQNALTHKWVKWVVVSHLCRLTEGIPYNFEPDKYIDIKCLSLGELFSWQTEPVFDETGHLIRPGLSKSLILGRDVYGARYGQIAYYK